MFEMPQEDVHQFNRFDAGSNPAGCTKGLRLRWGIVEICDKRGLSEGFHVVPLVDECLIVPPHGKGVACPCGPIRDKSADGHDVWLHYEPKFPGSMTEEQWKEKLTKLTN